MHHTREDAERVLAAATAANGAGAPPVADGGVKDEESETPAATGAKDPDKGKAEHIGAAPAGSPKNQADASAAGGKDSDTGTTEHIGAAPAESLEIPADAPTAGSNDSDTGKTEHIESLEIEANKYTREVAQWLTSLTSKASERGVFCRPF